MTKNIIPNRSVYYGLTVAAVCLLAACSDWRDGIAPDNGNTAEQAITLGGSVVSSNIATRSDGTIINWKQTGLPPTEAHDYYRVDENGAVIKESKTFYAGLFGCYTGPYHWASLVLLHGVMADGTISDAELAYLKSKTPDFDSYTTGAALQTDAPTILSQYYSANQLYNVRADIGALTNGNNPLTYSPQRLWPNDGKYMTFWGYYPYNATSTQGDYGIAIVNDDEGVGEGKGMGKVHFTMHPDASLQNDFLISAPVVDCTRDDYPLQLNNAGTGYDPKPIRLYFYHMLAQVRIYAYVTGTDKLVYSNETYTAEEIAAGAKYIDEMGIEQTPAVGDKKIDEEKSIRWWRTDISSVDGKRKRADISYSMEFNNIKTSASFYPDYTNPSGATIGYTPATTLGYATINNYIMNPYWFTFKDGQRERLNDNYMFGYFQDTPAYNRLNASTTMEDYNDIDGIDWSNTTEWGTIDDNHKDPMGYLSGKDADHLKLLMAADAPEGTKYYNYATGNILLVVPQTLNDDDVPHIVITAKGTRRVWNSSSSTWEQGEDLSAKVTINMLKMGIKWESGFIYCYAFLDDLKPGDDKVRGPESITVVFDTTKYTDQW